MFPNSYLCILLQPPATSSLWDLTSPLLLGQCNIEEPILHPQTQPPKKERNLPISWHILPDL